jgi:hypothetical protein
MSKVINQQASIEDSLMQATTDVLIVGAADRAYACR